MTHSIRQTLYRFLDNQPSMTLSGWNLYEIMIMKTGIRTMPATLLQYLRDYADASGAGLECIDGKRSQYKYTPGFKIAGALGGKE